MHPNRAFRKATDARALDFARDRSFGTLAVNADGGPRLSHVPFLIDAAGQSLDLHLVRSNPILGALECDAVVSILGPDAYLSPDWYDVPDQVPTWNYVAVHLRGRLTRLPQDAMRDMLDRQSAGFEDWLNPKTPWTTDKMTPDILTRMMRQIVPCRMTIEDVQSTWKLSQNKPDPVRLAAADHVETSGIGSEVVALSRLMRDPDSEV
ncbi:MAG: FMN-binding negative transcriptional regulator [Pseudomonadota bacterium]